MHPPASSTNDGRRPPSSPFLLFLLLLLLLIAASLPASIMALQCFECFDRNQPCTRFSNCTGSACVLYENMPNRTSVAFCLLATAERQDEQMAQGCWRDGDSKGVECLCTSDFCNAPRDPWTSDPNSAPIPGLKMLDKNPFVDYEYLDEEKAVEGKKNDVGELDDAELPPEGQDQDLMPKQFDDYLDWERRTRNRNQTPKEEDGNQNIGGAGPSPTPGSSSVPPPSSSPSVDLPQSDDNGTVIYVEMDNSALVIHRPFLAAWPLAASILLLPHFLSSSNIYYCFFF